MSTLTSRTAEVTLYQGEDRAKITELSAAVGEAEQKRRSQSKQPLMLNEDIDAEVEAAVKRYNAAVTAAKKRALTVKLSAVPYLTWRRLKNEHPAREGVPEDQVLGLNWDTFPVAAITACWQDESVPNRAEQIESLCEADFLLLFAATQSLNTSQGFDPKAVTVSDLTLVSDET